ncbi:MAG: EAL domain-containing protein [Actinobacteria bacterium]|nr:EAL domain-containing protein [Actinomycetota bacterium]MCA1720331.1 EAL domain-containing protein [Actinomycetota bacterium]
MTLSLAAVPLQRPTDPGTPDLVVKMVLAGMASTRMVFQPVVHLGTAQVVGYEALARFGATGMRTPAPYFAAAAACGREADLEAHLVAQALAVRAELPGGCFLAVNVSPALLSSPQVWSLLRTESDLAGLVLELTEHVPVDNLASLRRRMDLLRDRGALLALDDTGAGWSGLRQVAELRPDIVKLDRSLVTDVDTDPVKQGLMELVGQFVDRLGSTMLVEGVERTEELDTAVRLGATLAQGYLLGRPTGRWSEIPTEVRELLVRRPAGGDVGAAVDTTAPCVRKLAAIGFLPGEPADVVVVDADRRPLALWVRNPEEGAPSGWAHPVMTALASEDASVVVARAMTRPSRTRFDPVVCVAADGSYLGLLHVEHLVTAAVTAR